MSAMALELIGIGSEMCLPVTVGRGPEASLLCDGKRNLSEIASLEEIRLNGEKLGDFGDESWISDCVDLAILHWTPMAVE